LAYSIASDFVAAFRPPFVSAASTAGQLIPRAEAVLRQIGANAPLAVKFVLDAVNKGLDGTQDQGLLIEASLFGLCAATEDKAEGISAFLAKRAPNFHGR
jgi:enoyl-CoA hydratase